MKTRKQLPAELRRPISNQEVSGAIANLPNDELIAMRSLKRDELANRMLAKVQAPKLVALLHWYEVPVDDPNCWALLAFELARDFIPGLSLAPPPSSWKPAPLTLQAYYKLRPARGRPRKWTEFDYRILVQQHSETKATLRARNPHSRITDRQAMEEVVKRQLAERGETRAGYRIRNEASKLAKRLSEARNFVRKSEGK